ncbi:sodium:proton antiporter [Alkalihalobacillus oceani]|uniref:cation:proton antiporter n=1 Tax=Halalkalibacter oceani TaxID=1653776 RepID=UPI00203CFF47|nr:sodium:proton antiporter [Halalkalibacter oceani]
MESFHVILLLFIGYIVFTIDKKKEAFPVPVVLVLLGVCLSFIPFFHSIELTKDMIFDWFLPALLFISAYHFPFSQFKKRIGMILSLSTVGLLVMALLLAASIYVIAQPFVALSFLEALVMASILTPSDPVTVISILKQASGEADLAYIVEGESMVNDGTSIVLFTVVAGVLATGESFRLISFFSDFFIVSIAGILIGVLFGWIVTKAVHLTHHRQYQIMLSIILAYGSFYCAEHLGVSGVLASVTAGLMLSRTFEKSAKEEHFRQSLDGFWDAVEPSILALLFLIIGIVATKYLSFQNGGLIVLIFGATLLIRYLVVAWTSLIKRSWRNQMNRQKKVILTMAGIKGAMSVALLLSLEADLGGQHHDVISLTFGTILVSLCLQSILIYPLTKSISKRGR